MPGKMEWKVTSCPIGDKTIYGVYRIIDPNEVHHSGNRETYGEYVDTRAEAAAIADRLNQEDFQKLQRAEQSLKYFGEKVRE